MKTKCMQCGGSTKKMAKGGSAKSDGCPPGYRDINGECVKAGILDSKSARIGLGTALTGMMGVGAKAIADKVRAKRTAKKESTKPAEKKMQMGGSMGIVGMPKYSNDPRTDAGRTLKKGGAVKKYAKGGFPDLSKDGKITKKDILIGKGVIPKAKFGASVSVQHSPAPGRVRSSSGTGTVPVGMRKKKGGAVKK